MKNLWLILLVIVFWGCNSRNKTTNNDKSSEVGSTVNEAEVLDDFKALNGDEIMLDSSNIYVFKDNQKKVTGILSTKAFVENDEIIRKFVIKNGIPIQITDYSKGGVLVGECNLKNGKFEGEYKLYYPDGKLKSKYYAKNGKPNGFFQTYDKNMRLIFNANYKDGLLDGIAKYYNDGVQVKEVVYENGKEIKSYKFDRNGHKITPVYESLELVQYKTGYYEYNDYNKGERLYQPIVILKFKNISGKPLKEEVVVTGVFTSNNEEWSQESFYFQRTWETPLQPDISRQLSVKSDVGWTNPAGVGRANISCKILINGEVYKTIKIANKFVSSNRL